MEDTAYSVFDRNLESPSVPLDPYLDDNSDIPIRVTDATSKSLAPWWQGLCVIASGVAQLPLLTYRRLQPRGKERATDHPTYKVLHRRTNPELGPFAFKEMMTMQCVSRGNAYAWIERRGAEVRGLWPFPPGTVLPVRENNELRYVYTPEDGRGQEILSPAFVFHLRGPGDDGLEGKSLVSLARDSLSGGLQAQRYATKFFRNEAKPGVVLEFPESVDGETAKNVLKHWQNRHGGPNNVNKPALLDRGGKVHPFSMSNADAQFIESREFSRTEVASWLNLPPHKVGDLSRATFSNIEQQSIDFVVHSLMPWLIRWQDECNAKLFKTIEINQERYFCEFLVSALLRGDYNSRMDGHTKALRMGLMTIDELRDVENLNPLPNGMGAKHYITLDLAPVDQPPEETEKQVDETTDDSVRQILSVCLQNEIHRAYERASKDATRAATAPERLYAWLGTKLAKEREKLSNELGPVCEQAQRAGIVVDCDYIAAEFAGDIRGILSAELEGDPSTLKARVAGPLKRLAVERPAELTTVIWS